ncbi:MAG: hypothetical protein RL391_1870, partial [Actinomycetota bacterium]
EPSAFLQLLMDQGFEHESEVFTRLETEHGVVRLPAMGGNELAGETATSMRKGARLILAGGLPTLSGRSGKPDILIRVDQPSRNAAWGYVPVDAKSHRGFDGKAKAKSWLIGSIESPFLETAAASDAIGTPVLEDSLQLAHYWEMLSELGWNPTVDPIGGIFDVDFQLVWRRLDQPFWRHEHPGTGESSTRSALEILGIEWEFRWEAIARMLDGETPITEPILHGNCSTCPWKDVCYDELRESEHVSLIAGVTKAHVKKLALIGVRTQTRLANLDVRTALLFDRAHAANVDLTKYRLMATDHPDQGASVKELTGRSRKALEFLESEGFVSVSDLMTLDPTLAEMPWFSNVTRRIDAARVRLHPDGLPHLPRGEVVPAISRADIEIDVDMENSDVVYLWGTNTTIRNATNAPSRVREGYRPFHTLAGGHANEAEAFEAFWKWMHELIHDCERDGASIRFYCYTDAENTRMHEIASRWPDWPGVPSHDEIDSFCASEHWVDLKVNVDSLIWPTDTLGLKKVAPLAGFTWRDEDAGGDNSILWYDVAVNSVDDAERRDMSDKLLRYNEDDVLATKVLREWIDAGLNGRGPVFRSVTDLDELYE